MSWKYIIVRKGQQELPIIFPDTMIHADVAAAIQAMFVAEVEMMTGHALSKQSRAEIRDACPVVSAGSLLMGASSASGSSETLGIGSRDTDTAFINSHPYTKGWVG